MSLSLEERINPLKYVLDYDIDVDEDGLMFMEEIDEAAKDAAMSDMKDEYTDDTETASKVWHSKNPNDPVVRR